MKLIIVRDGSYTLNNGEPASNLLHYEAFGRRYLDVFDEVQIAGRLFQKEDPTAKPVAGEGVRFLALPGRNGALGFLKSLPALLRFALDMSNSGDAYILRVPGTIPSLFFFILWFKKIPFSVEVAADPYDSYSSKALDGHFLSKVVQKLFVWLVRKQCEKASASVYVTSKALQKRYPPGKPEMSYGFTSIDLPEDSFVSCAKDKSSFNLDQPHLVLIGNMQGSMKGHDVLIRATKSLFDRGFNLKLTIIGYGNNQPMFEAMVKEFGLEEVIHFTGKMPAGEPIRAILKNADLFILPSRQEGLPRALLEAMTQALPAIGTKVGGTPELLDEIALIDPDSPLQLADKIQQFLSDPELLLKQSITNLNRAKEYSASVIKSKRNSFLMDLKRISAHQGDDH